jgi:hypothetical protein
VTGAVDIAGEKNGFVSAILSSVETGTVGNGGNINIDSVPSRYKMGLNFKPQHLDKGMQGM